MKIQLILAILALAFAQTCPTYTCTSQKNATGPCSVATSTGNSNLTPCGNSSLICSQTPAANVMTIPSTYTLTDGTGDCTPLMNQVIVPAGDFCDDINFVCAANFACVDMECSKQATTLTCKSDLDCTQGQYCDGANCQVSILPGQPCTSLYDASLPNNINQCGFGA